MFRERLTTLDLNKPDTSEKPPQLELSPEQLEQRREVIAEAQKDRVPLLQRILGKRVSAYLDQHPRAGKTTDLVLNNAPLIGELKSGFEGIVGKTLGGKQLSPFERLLWSSFPVMLVTVLALLATDELIAAGTVGTVKTSLGFLQNALVASDIKTLMSKGLKKLTSVPVYISERFVSLLDTVDQAQFSSDLAIVTKSVSNSQHE